MALAALPDEVVGALTHAMGGAAKSLKVLDARNTRPMELVIVSGVTKESWELDDVAALAHNLNSLFAKDEAVGKLLVLGEFHDALQLWAVPHHPLLALLESGLVSAQNAHMLARQLRGESEGDTW